MTAKKTKQPVIKKDERNVNKHNEKSKAAVKKSLEHLGAGRSIVVDAEDTIIGGECTYEQAVELGLPVKVIESDGSELIVVKRTDLTPDDPKRRALAIADNQTGRLSSIDFAAAGKELKTVRTALNKLKIKGLDATVTGFNTDELKNLVAKKKPSTSSGSSSESTATSAGSGNADNASAGLQSDGKNVYFGQDQYEVVERFLEYAHDQQGDESTDGECIVWGLLQLLEGSGF